MLVRAVRTLAEQTDLDTVEAISLSGQMQSVILVGATGAAVSMLLCAISPYVSLCLPMSPDISLHLPIP